MTSTLRRISASKQFTILVFAAIAVASVMVGLETYPEVEAAAGEWFRVLDTLVMVIFVAEVAIKIAACGRRPWAYFEEPWNALDFGIVVATILPINSSFTAVVRLVRVLRVLRLVKALPKLRMIVEALINSFSAMGYISMLLGLLFYIFATLGVSLFGDNDPLHFGRLELAFLTLFQLMTLDDWRSVLEVQQHGAAGSAFYQGREDLIVQSTAWPVVAPIYFLVFILLGTMVVLNLFIGVISNSMTEAQQKVAQDESRARARRDQTRASHLAAAPNGASVEHGLGQRAASAPPVDLAAHPIPAG